MTLLPVEPAVPTAELSDADLLAAVARNDRPALGELARRYVDFVYASAVRQLGDRHAAEDVTQAVFLVLAKKAGRVHAPALAAWLHQTTVYAANNARRGARRRRRHELAAARPEAVMPATPPDAATQEMLIRLDQAIAALPAKDRIAVCGRFLRGEELAAVAAALNTTPAGAQKRIERAVEALRRRLSHAGRPTAEAGTAVLPAAVLAALALAAPSPATAAPLTLAITAAASPSAASIANGVIAMTIASKAKTAVAVALVLLLGVVAVEGVRRYAAPATQASATRPTSIDPALIGGWRTVQQTFADGILSPATAASQSMEIAADGQCRLHNAHSPDEPARIEPVAPGEIDVITADGTRRPARYIIEGDRLWLRHAEPNAPRPAPFDQPLTGGATEIELRRTTDLTPPLLATFADGAAVELLAVGDPATGQWWTPDGRPTDPPAGVGTSAAGMAGEPQPGRRAIAFVTVLHGPVVGRSRIEPRENNPLSWRPPRDGLIGTLSVTQIKADATTIDWHTDLAARPQTVSIVPDAAGDWSAASEEELRSPGGRTFRLSTMIESTGRRAFVLRPFVGAFEKDDANVALIGADGREMTGEVQPVDSAGVTDAHYRVIDGQPANVVEARLTLHHYDRWAEFRGVATRAGSAAKPTTVTNESVKAFTATFADGVEVELIAIGETATGQWWTPFGESIAKPERINDLALMMKPDPGGRVLCFVTDIHNADAHGITRARLEPEPERPQHASWGSLAHTGKRRDVYEVRLDPGFPRTGLRAFVATAEPQTVVLRPDSPGRWKPDASVDLASPVGTTFTLSNPHEIEGHGAFFVSPYADGQFWVDDLNVTVVGPGGIEWPTLLAPQRKATPMKLEAQDNRWRLDELTEARMTLRRFDRQADFHGFAMWPGERATTPRVVVHEPPTRDVAK